MGRNLRRNGAMPEPPTMLPPETPVAPPDGMRQLDMSRPERQMMLRIWALEDENAELRQANADLQTALAKATMNAVPVPPVPGPGPDDS